MCDENRNKVQATAGLHKACLNLLIDFYCSLGSTARGDYYCWLLLATGLKFHINCSYEYVLS